MLDGGVFDFTGEPSFIVGRTPLGNWEWRVYFTEREANGAPKLHPNGQPVVHVEKGHEATEQLALGRARLAAGRGTPSSAPAAATKPGAFATIRAPTSSSRYGKLPGRPTYARDFKHGELHLCAHGQRQEWCPRCGYYCGCPGSPKHECRSAA